MTDRIVVVGGGVGGLVAALRARQSGAEVTLIEARSQLGGLASSVTVDGTTFDGGPYILLDRHRLHWALDQVGVALGDLEMVELDPAYRVTDPHGTTFEVRTDLDATAERFDVIEPGLGDRYRQFVQHAMAGLDHLNPLLTEPHSPRRFLTSGAWRASPWVLLSLRQLLRRHKITGPAATAVQIWTLIAGGDVATAPGPMALVPALIHRDGAARPVGGIHQVITLLERALASSGVEVVTNTPVVSITEAAGRVSGVALENGERLSAPTVISDVGGAAALLDLVDVPAPPLTRARLAGPLQSPGLTAYVRLRGTPPAEIRFEASGDPMTARAVIHPNETDADGWAAGRVIAPLGRDRAEQLGESGQRDLLDRYIADSWWRDGIDDVEIAATRLVGDWGRTFRLRDDAMNLVMARRQMLAGRLPHRIRHLPGLYLTGSWTHPGQWISFCAVSGVLAADAALHDLDAVPS